MGSKPGRGQRRVRVDGDPTRDRPRDAIVGSDFVRSGILHTQPAWRERDALRHQPLEHVAERAGPGCRNLRVAGSSVTDVGARVVAALADPGAHELFEVLEGPTPGANLIGRLHARDDTRWLAELLSARDA